MPVVSMRELLEAGVHFGHQTRRWNPKMRRFLFTERGGIYIIDLQQTQQLVDDAHAFVRNVAERGGSVLFVGTKKQCQDAIEEQAKRVGMPYVNHRWLGGLLTNWRTISNRLERLEELRRLRDEGQLELLPSKERLSMLAELEKLETNLGGVSDMKDVPDVVFLIDLKKEQLAVREAKRLKIPVVALVDTNCDPDDADFVIPGNDDAISSCSLITRAIADGVEAGKQVLTERELVAAAERQAAAEVGREGEGRGRQGRRGSGCRGSGRAAAAAGSRGRGSGRGARGGGGSGAERGGEPVTEIPAALVKQLRDMTGAGMMECKRALVETEGDLEAAVTLLREKGLAAAAKRAGRETNEGEVKAHVNGSRGAIVAVGCETEPVSGERGVPRVRPARARPRRGRRAGCGREARRGAHPARRQARREHRGPRRGAHGGRRRRGRLRVRPSAGEQARRPPAPARKRGARPDARDAHRRVAARVPHARRGLRPS